MEAGTDFRRASHSLHEPSLFTVRAAQRAMARAAEHCRDAPFLFSGEAVSQKAVAASGLPLRVSQRIAGKALRRALRLGA